MPGMKVRGRDFPNPGCYLSDTDIVRVSEPQHPVQDSRGEGNLRRLGPLGARAKGITDHALVHVNTKDNHYQREVWVPQNLEILTQRKCKGLSYSVQVPHHGSQASEEGYPALS